MGSGGGKGGGVSVPKNPYEKAMADIAKQYYAQTQPVRTDVLGQLGQFTGGETSVLDLPGYKQMYDLARGNVESQYGQARQNILASTPRGGALTSALTSADLARAQQVGQLPASIGGPLTQDMWNKAFQTATTSPGQAMGGLGGAASSFGQSASTATAAALQQQQMQSQMFGGLGTGLGMLMAAALLT